MKETDFTILFKSMRANANLALRPLGEALGYSPVYLNDLERGNREPTEKVAKKLIEFYQLDEAGQRMLYDSIATATNSIPFDVIAFLKDRPEELDIIISNMQNQYAKSKSMKK